MKMSGAPRCPLCGRHENVHDPEACARYGAELERSLTALAEFDPAVAAAAERLREATSEHEKWRRTMIQQLWGDNQ